MSPAEIKLRVEAALRRARIAGPKHNESLTPKRFRPQRKKRKELTSAYHFFRAIEQGKEIEPTLYWRDRILSGARYHIDYCFVPHDWTKSIRDVIVGQV